MMFTAAMFVGIVAFLGHFILLVMMMMMLVVMTMNLFLFIVTFC